jgi:hypothetical protein
VARGLPEVSQQLDFGRLVLHKLIIDDFHIDNVCIIVDRCQQIGKTSRAYEIFLTILTTDDSIETRNFRVRNGLVQGKAPAKIDVRGIRFELYHSLRDAIGVGPDRQFLMTYLDRMLIAITLRQNVPVGRFLHQIRPLLLGRHVITIFQMYASHNMSEFTVVLDRSDEQALLVFTPEALALCGLPGEVQMLTKPFTTIKAHTMEYTTSVLTRPTANSTVIDRDGKIWTVQGGLRGNTPVQSNRNPEHTLYSTALAVEDTGTASKQVRDLVANLVDERLQMNILPLVTSLQNTVLAVTEMGAAQHRTETTLEELHNGLRLSNDRTLANEVTLNHLTQLMATNVTLVQQLAELQLAHRGALTNEPVVLREDEHAVSHPRLPNEE